MRTTQFVAMSEGMAIVICIDWCCSDTTCFLVEHGDAAEALSVLKTLEEHGGPDAVAFGDMTIVERESAPRDRRTLPDVVSGHLFQTWGANAQIQRAVFDKLPLVVLRAAVEHLAVCYERETCTNGWHAEAARRLREALFLREQRDRIAADLAEMEQIGSMTVE